MEHGIFKTQLKGSIHGLKGSTPATREGALTTSQLHAQKINPTIMKAEHSIYDLDGANQPKYLDNPPE